MKSAIRSILLLVSLGIAVICTFNYWSFVYFHGKLQSHFDAKGCVDQPSRKEVLEIINE